MKDGRLVTPSGMSYRLLVLDSNALKMSLPVLGKISQLVKAGATISGVKPESTPSLKDDQSEFQRLVAEVWSSANANVYIGKPIAEVLKTLNIKPDFEFQTTDACKQSSEIRNPKFEILYVHRKLPHSDIYWVNNRSDTVLTVEAKFRISGKVPQIWHPETGKTNPATYSIANGQTTVSLRLTPYDALFVVFALPAIKTSHKLPVKTENEMETVQGSWNVSFQPNRGAPPEATFNQLTSWTQNSDAGIKYFSGTATYTKTIKTPAKWLSKGGQIWLDLGEVKDLAEVTINGKSLGIVWKKPFRVDVTDALKAGNNNLEIKVTNLWVNRLIGDQQPGVTNKLTFTIMPFYKADSPLLSSGLLGPVRIIAVK